MKTFKQFKEEMIEEINEEKVSKKDQRYGSVVEVGNSGFWRAKNIRGEFKYFDNKKAAEAWGIPKKQSIDHFDYRLVDKNGTVISKGSSKEMTRQLAANKGVAVIDSKGKVIAGSNVGKRTKLTKVTGKNYAGDPVEREKVTYEQRENEEHEEQLDEIWGAIARNIQKKVAPGLDRLDAYLDATTEREWRARERKRAEARGTKPVQSKYRRTVRPETKAFKALDKKTRKPGEFWETKSGNWGGNRKGTIKYFDTRRQAQEWAKGISGRAEFKRFVQIMRGPR